MKTLTHILLLLASLLVSSAQAADSQAGKTKATTCAGCHGPAGISTNPLWPDLAGQKDQYLIKQMKDFRDGNRSDPVMAPMALGLSDEDIADLAAYYNELER